MIHHFVFSPTRPMSGICAAAADGSRGARSAGPRKTAREEFDGADGPNAADRAQKKPRSAELESAKIGPAGLPRSVERASVGRWPSGEGRVGALRPAVEPKREWSAAAIAPSPPPSPTEAAKPEMTGQTQMSLPPWLAAKTGMQLATPAATPSAVPPPVATARPRARHGMLLVALLLMVVAPVAVSAWYLYARAADQYASTLAFSVRKEEGPSASELLGGLTGLSGASSSDTDVLAEFIQSQDLVRRIDTSLDLRSIYTKPSGDPIFTLKEDAPIEDLVVYWNRMVTLYYDGAQGLIEVRVLAFAPQDAEAIANAIYNESSLMINALTAIARDDATRFARGELEAAVDRLKAARTALTEFRTRTQIVDPNADIQGQMGLLNTLQAQLADSLIELDLLRETTREGDPRIRQTEQRIAVIEKRIEEERAKFGIGGGGASDEAFADLVGEYESLIVDREFAEQAYLTALTNFDSAQAEAQRQSRYLAAHIQPTLAESAEYPRREMILLAIGFFAVAAWGTALLIYYSIKDRR
ncbi:MAG: capsule biosynthesis protein [Pseudomonadota bacterium]